MAINSSLKKNKSKFRITDDAFDARHSTSLYDVKYGNTTAVLKAVTVNKTDKFNVVGNTDDYDPYKLFLREASAFNHLSQTDSQYTVRKLEGPFEADLGSDEDAYFLIMKKYIPINEVHTPSILKYHPRIEDWIIKYGLNCVMAYMGYCISSALKELHSVGITAQRDIKPENIYIDREDEDMFKCRFILGDFGTAHIDGATLTETSSEIGTLYYVPGANEKNTDWQYDQFMLGVNLYERFNGAIIPLPVNREGDKRYAGWASGKKDIPNPIKNTPDGRLWEIIKKMTSYNVPRRYADPSLLISEFKNLYTAFAEEAGYPISEKDEPDAPVTDIFSTKTVPYDKGPSEKTKKKINKKYLAVSAAAVFLIALILLSIPFFNNVQENKNLKIADSYYDSEDYDNAVIWYRKAAESGNAEAQYKLGFCYERGYSVEHDYSKAVKWYLKAAENENAEAQYSLGWYFENGIVGQDEYEAVKWYQKAAENGHADAQYDLGRCFENGTGVNQDAFTAVEWYQKAAGNGNAQAQYRLGWNYAYGNIPQDYNKAVEWYQKAAENGITEAQNELGNCYYDGNGVKQDYKKAVEWYQMAADNDNAKAQYSLGTCYEYGYGVKKDMSRAVEWYQKAADQGQYEAQERLERLNNAN